ncbi:MAG TPA: GlsB/YeaQ/YmgE family stress response membrane protein [Bauldia sp.]|nr:GlsB/YeaQ/YmgE family stress response membrane protein [Bauldia sp.]
MNRQIQFVLSWVLAGLIVGLLAAGFSGGARSTLFYLGCGLVGAVVGGLLAQLLRLKLNTGNPFLDRLVVALVGAVIVLLIAPAII